MHISIPLEDAMRSQRAIRFLKDEPVSDELLLHLLDLAIRAPCATNRQNWDFVVVRDRKLVAEFGRLNRQMIKVANLLGYFKQRPGDKTWDRMLASFKYQEEHFDRTPVLVIPCFHGWIPPFPFLIMTSSFGSIYPAVQNLLLAARGAGLGAALITLPIWNQGKVRRLLGLPWNVTPCAVVPMGWSDEEYRPNVRRPVGEVVHLDGYGRQPWRKQSG